MQWIYFFGLHTYDWVEIDQIIPFSDRQYEFTNLSIKPSVKYIFEEVDKIIGNWALQILFTISLILEVYTRNIYNSTS